MAKYIFVTGGVVSSLGKGISAASLGMLLKRRGLKVFMIKFDPYLNVDPGTMSPYQHGEVYVTEDGGETDLDIGHYERWVDENFSKLSSVTSGKVYSSVIQKERHGDYLGGCVQVVPHITDEIKSRLYKAAKQTGADIVIGEIGGTVGDIESLPFLEAIRQVRLELGIENTFFLHNTLVPYLRTSGESKTKPTQHSTKELAGLGIQPDAIVLRSEVPLDEGTKKKVSLFCNIPYSGVFEADDCPCIYELPLRLHAQGIDEYVAHHFGMNLPLVQLADYEEFVSRVQKLKGEVTIALVGKYVQLHDAYLSVREALLSAGYAYGEKVHVRWIQSDNIQESNVAEMLKGCDGVLVPGGFGQRGTDGMKIAIRYARENQVPYLGICLGMQLATIEFAENVLGMKKANSTEFDPQTPFPVIDILRDQYQGIDMGGTLRLGAYDCDVQADTLAMKCYASPRIQERHRHRYEFNKAYQKDFEDHGMVVSGINPELHVAEIVELKNHPFFVGCQFHPEFTSRTMKPNPLFKGFVHASILHKEEK